MNDIDRSVETFDFALLRRFDWVEIKADEVMESSLISMNSSGPQIFRADKFSPLGKFAARRLL